MTAEQPRYEFGPLARRSVLAGMSAGQVLLLAAGLVASVIVVRIDSTARGMSAALLVIAAAVAAAFWPVAGRPAYEWAPVAARWAAARVSGRHRHWSSSPQLGCVDGEAVPDPPAALKGVRILSASVAGTPQPLGVIHDWHSGIYAAVLAVRGRSFELADTEEKARRLQSWGALLASMGRAGSPVTRLQWIERTVQEDGDELGRYLASAVHVPNEHPALDSYQRLIEAAGPASQPHEVLLVVGISPARARHAVKAAGGGEEGAKTVLVRELMHLQRDLASSEITVDHALTPRMVAGALRTAFDPPARSQLARLAGGDPALAGTCEAGAWPMGAEALWDCYRTEGVWHATYWIAELPRMPVGPDFLAPLIVGTVATRTISLTMQPVPAVRAHREVENALVQTMADDELRARAGFLGTARRRRQLEALTQREEELAAGHTDYRVTGYVTVTAGTREALEVACGEVEQAAERCRLQLCRLYGQQDLAFTCTLPLARGLA